MNLWLYLIYWWVVFDISSAPIVYYVSTTGNDANDGRTIHRAWRSIERVNRAILGAGDRVLFEGGSTFDGTILLDSLDGGTAVNPLIISSYGNKPALINAGNGKGFFGHNCAGVKLQNLRFQGSGVGKNTSNGIEFYNSYQNKSLTHITIDSCEVKGFQKFGILIIGDKSDSDGYRNVRITHCIAHENGEAGIASLGKYPAIPHRDFYVGYNKAFNNRGILTKTNNHSGNGIVMAGIDSVLIEHCEAYENGADNRCTAGGPVGIWLWACRNGIIQHSVSHHNHAGLTKDGGGFDIDGGSTNCIIRDCYSHDNEGAGYLLAQFDCPIKFGNNKLINNVSRNDGLKNSYGSITLWGENAENEVTNSEIKGNRCYVDARNVINGQPCGVRLSGTNFRGVVLTDNYFEISTNAQYIYADEEVPAQKVHFKNNNINRK